MAHTKKCPSHKGKAWSGTPATRKGKEGWTCDDCNGFIECETEAEIAARAAQVAHIQTKDINPKDLIGVTKVPVHLVSPIAIVQESIANFLGATKYGAWNWRGKETRASVYYAAAMRHLFLWWSGEDMDSDGTPHLTNARCCLAIIMEGTVIGNMKDDRPPKVNLKQVMREVEALMPIIAKKYGHMNPKHFTIADKVRGDARRKTK